VPLDLAVKIDRAAEGSDAAVDHGAVSKADSPTEDRNVFAGLADQVHGSSSDPGIPEGAAPQAHVLTRPNHVPFHGSRRRDVLAPKDQVTLDSALIPDDLACDVLVARHDFLGLNNFNCG
jgi:hypothetical protein